MRKYFTLLAALCMMTASAQKAKFSTTELDLGEVEWHTSAMANIKLTNTGHKPLYITNVETDCGCTVVSWSHAAIAPNETTTITATYDAETLGYFGRYISVTTNADTEPVEILIFGRVLTEVHDIARDFPIQIDDIYLSADNVEFDDINLGDNPSQIIYVLNKGKQNYMPELMHLPKYLTMNAQPEILRPGRMGKIALTIDSRQLPSMGLNQTSIYVARYPGDKVRKAAEIGISATLLPQFEGNAVQLQQQPVADIPTFIDLGNGKKKMKGSLTLENKGTGVLHVSKLQVYNPGITVSLSKSVLAPGEKATLRVSVSGANDKFKGRRRILLITDDPNNSKITIDVNAQ